MSGERFVLKIANALEDAAMLEAQNAAMEHGMIGLRQFLESLCGSVFYHPLFVFDVELFNDLGCPGLPDALQASNDGFPHQDIVEGCSLFQCGISLFWMVGKRFSGCAAQFVIAADQCVCDAFQRRFIPYGYQG